MKKVFQQILSFCMAFIVMFSTMSFSVDMHYCGDTLIDFSLMQNVKSCGMEKQAVTDCETTISKKSCCSDKTVTVKGQDDLKTSFDKFSFEQQVFITSFVYSYKSLFEVSETTTTPFKAYSPPFIIRDVQLLDQIFLI